MARTNSTFLLLLSVLFLFLSACLHAQRERKAAEVSGDNGSVDSLTASCGCSSPAPAPSTSQPILDPDPDLFLNIKQYNAYRVIQRFKLTITCDPNGVTNSWVGYRPCNYTGFYCEAPPDLPETLNTIASIDFNGFRLCAPTVGGFVDQLPDLALFHANSNNFSGAIPDLTGLRYLYELDISNNIHSGSFPATVLPLGNLIFLDLRYNLFTGAVPASIFALGLDVLFLNNNNFFQPLPANLGSSTVAYLTLANNGFTGPIPRTIFNASKTLVEVLFLNNKLSGCLPYEIGLLSVATVFDAGFNQITGPIPWSFGCLLKMEQLNLAGNLLYGEVPDVVCRLAKDGNGNLANLSLSGNYFTSLGHSCWDLIKREVLDVRQNCIHGLPGQRTPAECWRFLWRPKYCPLLPFIPCSLPKCAVKPTAPTSPNSPAWPKWPATGRPMAPVTPGYKAYHALHQPPHN